MQVIATFDTRRNQNQIEYHLAMLVFDGVKYLLSRTGHASRDAAQAEADRALRRIRKQLTRLVENASLIHLEVPNVATGRCGRKAAKSAPIPHHVVPLLTGAIGAQRQVALDLERNRPSIAVNGSRIRVLRPLPDTIAAENL